MNAVKVVYGLGLGFLINQLIGLFLYLCFKSCDGDYVANVVFCISYAIGLALVVCSLFLKNKLHAISLGILTGGLMTLINPSGWTQSIYRYSYSYGYGGMGTMWDMNRGLMFGGIIVALIIIVFLGYKKLCPLSDDDSSMPVEGIEGIERKGGMGMTAIKVVYGLGIGLMLAMITGFGIAAFYQPPDYGVEESWGRNILLITSIFGLLFSLGSLLLPSRFSTIKLGLLSGGLLMIIGGIVVACVTIGVTWAFAATFIVLAILIVSGYFGLVSKRRSDIEE
jgi:hypothetical protein